MTDYFLAATERGHPERQQAVHDRLTPLIDDGNRITFGPDSYVRIWGLDEGGGVTLNDPMGDAVWDLIVEVQRIGRWLLAPASGEPLFVIDDEMRDQALEISPGTEVIVVASGTELRDALDAAGV